MTKKKGENGEIVAVNMKNEGEVIAKSSSDNSAEQLLSAAVHQGATVEVMERLLAMKERLDAARAKREFDAAMAQFQKDCPVIGKSQVVKDKFGKERYKFAPLGEIVKQVKEHLANNGFSYSFDEVKDDKFATAICIVTHKEGHTEKSSFKVEIGTEDYMTNTQKYGARMTFAKRYAFCNAFGILTADEDNDANEEPEEKPIKPPFKTETKQEDKVIDGQIAMPEAKKMPADPFTAAMKAIEKETGKPALLMTKGKLEGSTGIYTEEQKAQLLAKINEKLASN